MRALSLKEKSGLFSALCRFEKSGVSRQDALSYIGEQSSEVSRRALKTLYYCKVNIPFGKAARNAGLIDSSEAPLIAVAEATGQNERIFEYFEDVYSKRLEAVNRLKAKLYLPAALFFLSLLIAPLPALYQQTIDFSDYFSQILLHLSVLFAAVYVLSHVDGWMKRGKPWLGVKELYSLLQLHTPVLNNIYVQSQVIKYFNMLAVALNAGLPVIESLKLAQGSLDNVVIKNRFAKLQLQIEAGSTLGEAVSRISFIRPEMKEAIKTGEYSGSLAGAVEQSVSFMAQFHRQDVDAVYEWMPRIIYFMVLAIMARGFF